MASEPKTYGQPILAQHRNEERELLQRLREEAGPSWSKARRDLMTLENDPDQ